jgi:hypothetical protein
VPRVWKTRDFRSCSVICLPLSTSASRLCQFQKYSSCSNSHSVSYGRNNWVSRTLLSESDAVFAGIIQTLIEVHCSGHSVTFVPTQSTATRSLQITIACTIIFLTLDVGNWLRHRSTNRKLAGLIPDRVTEIFHWLNPPSNTMAGMSTWDGKGGRRVRLTTLTIFMRRLSVNYWSLNLLEPQGTVQAYMRIVLPLLLYGHSKMEGTGGRGLRKVARCSSETTTITSI